MKIEIYVKFWDFRYVITYWQIVINSCSWVQQFTHFFCLFISPSNIFAKFNICSSFGLSLIGLKPLFPNFWKWFCCHHFKSNDISNILSQKTFPLVFMELYVCKYVCMQVCIYVVMFAIPAFQNPLQGFFNDDSF